MKQKHIIALAALLSCLPLAACMSDADVRASLSAKCASWGFAPGTPQHTQCVDQQEAALWSSAAGMVNANAAAMNAQRPRETTCTGYGATLRCTTY